MLNVHTRIRSLLEKLLALRIITYSGDERYIHPKAGDVFSDVAGDASGGYAQLSGVRCPIAQLIS
jgi:hypothetical protein